ncbi:MAG: hypothetical protein ACOC10_01165 [Bacteroidota bacterium]
MIEYAKVILWGVSFWEVLFKKELEKIVHWSDEEELAELRKYCYDKYSDMHPDVLNEVFGTSKISVANSRMNPLLGRRTMQNMNH